MTTAPQSISRSSLLGLEPKTLIAISVAAVGDGVGVYVGSCVASGFIAVCSGVGAGVGCILFKVGWGLGVIPGKSEF